MVRVSMFICSHFPHRRQIVDALLESHLESLGALRYGHRLNPIRVSTTDKLATYYDRFINYLHFHWNMGIKKTSETVAISFTVSESAPNTFAQQEIDLTLDVLNNEVFVVEAIDLDVTPPDAVAAVDTQSRGSLTSTSQTSAQSLANTNCLAAQILNIRAAGFVDGGVAFSRTSADAFSDVDYLGIIATNNFFIQVQGTANVGGKTLNGKLYGYRARADAATYAALVQSEVLSS